MDFTKNYKYLDVCLFALFVLLYACWHAFFPFLLLSFVVLWYRRELAWRIGKQKPKFFWGLFRLDEEPNMMTHVKFWFLGVAWSVLILLFMVIGIREYSKALGVYEIFSTIFYDTVAYIYPGHVDSELAIAKRALQDSWAAKNINIVVTDEIVQNELKDPHGVRGALMNYHYDFVCVTIYVIIFARPLIMQPFYQAAMNNTSRQFYFKKLNLWYVFINIFFIVFLYYMFFLTPIHRDNCTEIYNRAALLCSNLGTSGKYIAFPARIMAYWTSILFIMQLFIFGYLTQEQKHDNANSDN